MKEKILLIIKGFIIGMGSIIPGVSGGTLAITLGIYEHLIDIASHFPKSLKKNIGFIVFVGIGVVIAFLLGSRVCLYALEKAPLPTILFFTGLILGGVPTLLKKVQGKKKASNLAIFTVIFIAVIAFSFFNTGREVSFAGMNILDYLMLFIVGIVGAATLVIPGISGTATLTVLGYYKPILNTINDLTAFNNITHNLMVLIPFGIGMVLGIILISKVFEYLFKKYEIPTYFAIIAFVLSSVIGIFLTVDNLVFNPLTIGIGIITLIIGYVIAFRLEEK